MGQLFTAACGDVCRVCNGAEISIVRNAQFPKGGRQPDLFDKCCHCINAGQRGLLIAVIFNIPHCSGKPSKTRHSGFINVTVERRMDHCQTCPMIAVGVCAKLVFYLVRLKICDFSDFQNTVLRHGGGPCQLASQAACALGR